MKLVSFTGAQSTGKTTLLNHIQNKNADNESVVFVPEVTRVIKREYDLPINEEAGGLTQLLINSHHVENIFKKESPNVKTKILDRCIIDGYVYTNYLYYSQNYKNLLYKVELLSETLFHKLVDKYSVIFHTTHEGVELESDGERSDSVLFRESIIDLFEIVIAKARVKGVNVVRLSGTVEQRLQVIHDTFKNMDIDVKVL